MVGPSRTNLLVALALVILSVVWMTDAVAFVRTGLDRLPARYQWDQGEGLLLGLAAEKDAGRSIYPDLALGSQVIDNYPPIFVSLLQAGPGEVHERLEFGRRISFISALVAALLIALLAGLGASGRSFDNLIAALFAGSIFLALEPVRLWSSLARVDFLALAATLVGVLAMSWRGRPGRVLALIAFLVALWTKQSLIAAPLALVLVIGRRRPREALFFTFLALFAGGLGVLAMQSATQGRFLFHVLTANQTNYSFDLLRHHLLAFLSTALPLLLWAALGIFAARRDAGRRRFLLVWGLFGSISLMSLGKTGSSSNYMLEMLALLAILAGIGVGGATALARERPRLAIPVLLAFAAALFLDPPDLQNGRFAARLPARDLELEAGMLELQRQVALLPGEVLSWDMSLPVLAGKRLRYHPFVVPDLVRRGLLDEQLLLVQIESTRFALIVTSFDLDDEDRFAEETGGAAPMFRARDLEAIRRNYRKERVLPLPAHLGGAYVIYLPR